MLRDSININNLCCNPVVLKRVGKLFKNWAKNCLWAQFVAEIRLVIRNTENSSSSAAFRNILFYENIICFDKAINLFLSWVMLFVKTMSFPGVLINQIGFVPGPHPLLLITHCRFPWPWGQLKKKWNFQGCSRKNCVEYAFSEIMMPSCKWDKAVSLQC